MLAEGAPRSPSPGGDGGGGGGGGEPRGGFVAGQARNMANRVFFRIHPSVTDADIREHFSRFGVVTDVYIPVDPYTSKPKGVAYVSFDLKSHMEACMADRDQTLKGVCVAPWTLSAAVSALHVAFENDAWHVYVCVCMCVCVTRVLVVAGERLDVVIAQPKGTPAGGRGAPAPNNPADFGSDLVERIIIKGLSPDVTEADIREYCSSFGTVKEVFQVRLLCCMAFLPCRRVLLPCRPPPG